MRKDVHQNLLSTETNCWTDFSKEIEVLDQEQCKSSAFGASNKTIQLIGQIFELKVLPSSAPTLLSFDQTNQILSFSKPYQDGGSNIQDYKLHIKSTDEECWFLHSTVKVKYLSQEPDVPNNLFGRLLGSYQIIIFACNLSGLGLPAEMSVMLTGDLPYFPPVDRDVTDSDFDLHHSTFFVEYFFFSDHNDAPKVMQCSKHE